MKNFRFPRIIERKMFSVIFGGVGKRRLITDYHPKFKKGKRKFKMQWVRRSNQGWRNRVYGSMTAIKMRKVFGMLRRVPTFRR